MTRPRSGSGPGPDDVGGPASDAPRRLRPDTGAEWDLMVTTLMAIWGTGAAVFLILLVSTDPAASVVRSLDWMAVVAVTVLAMLAVGRAHLPSWTPDVCAYISYTIVGFVVLIDGDRASPYSFMYLWLAVHSFYFLPWRRATPQLAYIGLTYALFLFALEGPFPVVRWVITVTTIGVVVSTVALLRTRLDLVVDRLRALADTDALTGLHNRRAYDELIEIEIARADRTGQPLSLAIGDLDEFKAVNDRYGHQAGDAVLRRVGAALATHARRIDVAVRLGGEEFVLLMPGTDSASGFRAAERMRRVLREECPPDALVVTMSFGVASYPADAGDATALLAAADEALRTAKRSGRDRVIPYSRMSPDPR